MKVAGGASDTDRRVGRVPANYADGVGLFVFLLGRLAEKEGAVPSGWWSVTGG